MVLRTDLAAVIPCLNEEAAIGPLVSAVRGYAGAVFVVDDGSTDGTGKAAAAAGAAVIRHETPLGKGSALMAGWAEARRRGFRWALAMDGDGQHDPADIPAFLAASHRAPLIVGNRMGDARRMPWLRRRVNRWMSRRLSRLTGRVLPDTQCGFRLLQLDLLGSMPISAEHFEIESDVLVAFIDAGHPVEFVPVSVIYREERSKIRPMRDARRWFAWLRSKTSGRTGLREERRQETGLVKEA